MRVIMIIIIIIITIIIDYMMMEKRALLLESGSNASVHGETTLSYREFAIHHGSIMKPACWTSKINVFKNSAN